MQIGTLAKHFNLNPKTIRYYEAIGLLPKPQRAESGYREYGDEALMLLGFIQRAKLLGFTLEDIRELLSAQASGTPPCARVLSLVDAEIVRIDQRIKDLREFRAELTALRRDWSDVTAQRRRADAACLCPIIEEQTEVDEHPEAHRQLEPVRRKVGRATAAR